MLSICCGAASWEAVQHDGAVAGEAARCDGVAAKMTRQRCCPTTLDGAAAKKRRMTARSVMQREGGGKPVENVRSSGFF